MEKHYNGNSIAESETWGVIWMERTPVACLLHRQFSEGLQFKVDFQSAELWLNNPLGGIFGLLAYALQLLVAWQIYIYIYI